MTRDDVAAGTQSRAPALDPALRDRVFFLGARYAHHARHSGYEAFNRYVGTPVAAPVRFRWTQGRIGWPFHRAFSWAARHPWYSFGAHLTEWHGLAHMIGRRGRVFHVLYGDSDLWLLRLAHWLTGNRLVASFHQPSEDLRALGSIGRVARFLDAVILVSEAQRPYFEEFLPHDRVFVVPHGVDTDYFRPPEGPAPDDCCITVGSHLRDFETLRAAIELVWESNPRMRFVAVGTRIDKEVFPAMSDPRIRFLDGISDEQLLAAYQGATLAALSFHNATANNAMLEAMACGLPIVATDVGGLREYVPASAGVLCPPRDPRALADAMIGILGDRAKRDRMSRASRETAVALDFARIAERMAEVYRRVLARKR